MIALRQALTVTAKVTARALALALLVSVMVIPSAPGATCSLNIPLVTLPPPAGGGFSWGVGLGWNTHAVPSGVWVSNLGAGLAQFHPFGPGQTGLIVWTLSRDPLSGMIYAGTEIYDHPQPYKPPFFRSPNGGVTWTNVASTLPWHVLVSAVRPATGYVYALPAGLAPYGSAHPATTRHQPAPPR